MPRKPLFTDVIDAIRQRIAAGDYMLKDLPGERRLAEEMGVSYMTARKAVTALLEQGLLARRENGSLIVNPVGRDARTTVKIAILTPAYPSIHILQSRAAVSRVATERGIQFRPVEYVHWYDPIVTEAIAAADGVIVIPSTEPIPRRMLDLFCREEGRIAFLDDDMTDFGIPSVRLFAKRHIVKVFEHLRRLGHERIDCLNAQGYNREILRRVTEWRTWGQRKGCLGELIDGPAAPYTDVTAAAYRLMQKRLARGGPLPTALVCTTQPAALGSIRACLDAGIRVGESIAIAAINCEPTGRYFCPSLTGLEAPDIGPLVSRVLEWFASGKPWEGPLLLAPERGSLFLGESTRDVRISAVPVPAG